MQRIFRIFVSSTFSDLQRERSALHREVFPRLAELCRSYDCQFQVIDPRWGVKEEAGLDQRTMELCLEELEHCQKISPRLNFLILLGDRYGWQPLPRYIAQDEFLEICQAIAQEETFFDQFAEPFGMKAIDLLMRWYILDQNAAPASYFLQPRDGIFTDKHIWHVEIETALRQILTQGAIKASLSCDLRIALEQSAVHREISQGSLQVADTSSIFAFFREIENIEALCAALPAKIPFNFVDTNSLGQFDSEAHEQLLAMKEAIRLQLNPEQIQTYRAQWMGKDVSTQHIGSLPPNLADCPRSSTDNRAEDTLCHAVWLSLSQMIRRECEQMEPLDIQQGEIDIHRQIREDRAHAFVGRQSEKQAIFQYLRDQSNQPLLISGRSGSGKSALIASIISELQRDANAYQDDTTPLSNYCIIERCVGETPNSRQLQSLLQSLCHEIYELFQFELQKQEALRMVVKKEHDFKNQATAQIEKEYTIPEDITNLSKTFCGFLAKIPPEQQLYIFLDGLEQIDWDKQSELQTKTEALGQQCFAWLPKELPPNIRLVISHTSLQHTSEDRYSCQTQCAAFWQYIAGVPELSLGAMSMEEGEQMLAIWLREANRCLTIEQQTVILDKFGENGLPLYLKFACEEAKHWRSEQGIPEYRSQADLPSDLDGIIDNYLWRLCQKRSHGHALVAHSLGYIETAHTGISEPDLLSLFANDRELMGKLKEQIPAEFPEAQFPVMLWSRLLLDLRPYLHWYLIDGVLTMTFFHRKLGTRIHQRFVPKHRKELYQQAIRSIIQ